MRRPSTLVAALVIASCAPMQQQAWRTPPAVAGPRLEAHDFVSRDGAKLALGHAYGGASQFFAMWIVGRDRR